MATEAGFQTALRRVFKMEGGYVNDPADPGGETKFGISKRSYPHEDIAGLTEQEAAAIYRRDYFLRPGFDTLPDSIAGAVFDIGVNMGPREATILLQDALILAGNRVTVDGKCGPNTVRAAVETDPVELIALFRWRVATHYVDIANARSGSRKFLSGWLRRACALT